MKGKRSEWKKDDGKEGREERRRAVGQRVRMRGRGAREKKHYSIRTITGR